jgi:hypothetical protein
MGALVERLVGFELREKCSLSVFRETGLTGRKGDPGGSGADAEVHVIPIDKQAHFAQGD